MATALDASVRALFSPILPLGGSCEAIMSDCPYKSRLHAYYDGQLAAEPSRQIREHIAGCQICAQELDELAKLSRALAMVQFGEMTPLELARLHRNLDVSTQRGILRLAGALSAVAASVLIISLAWLSQTPASRTVIGTVQGPTHSLEAWERLAMGENVPAGAPNPGGLPDRGVAAAQAADRNLTNWMLDNLRKPNHYEGQ